MGVSRRTNLFKPYPFFENRKQFHPFRVNSNKTACVFRLKEQGEKLRTESNQQSERKDFQYIWAVPRETLATNSRYELTKGGA